ncbi:hypothetical protein VNO77_10278 [Canavalia gladiata]|uniref:Uncharacterized protein n=1 Tax=Canavalia gladiata TaxID=3824 RepID=A0AAN9QXR5_CANGL
MLSFFLYSPSNRKIPRPHDDHLKIKDLVVDIYKRGKMIAEREDINKELEVDIIELGIFSVTPSFKIDNTVLRGTQ